MNVMIVKILAVLLLFPCNSVVLAFDELPDSVDLPKMPDAYRNTDYRDMSKRNPYGMSIYDQAESAAEDEYAETIVVPLEESRKILKERNQVRKKQSQK